jgi:nucleotide-binding universal stress UspA family protein
MTGINHIVVGVDGRSGGWDALALARRLGRLGESRLTVAAAYPAIDAEHSLAGWQGVRDPDDAERVLAQACKRLGRAQHVDYATTAGQLPGYALQEEAARRHADLLVVGRSSRGPFARIVGGSAVGQLLDHPPCPVAIASPGQQAELTRPIARVAVAVDRSRESRSAIRWAKGLTQDGLAGRARLEILHVEPGTGGPIVAELSALSAGFDLLVVGTHGRGPLGRAVHGSVSNHLARHASCPVVAVPLAPELIAPGVPAR